MNFTRNHSFVPRHSSLVIAAAFAAAAARAAVPEVTSVTMTQSAQTREVTIAYTMNNAPAVVTLDVQTNATVNGETVWTSIGGEGVCNAQGAVWRVVTTADLDGGVYRISWHPDLSWPDHRVAAGGARAVVTAWALDNTPDYMVVDIANDGVAASQAARCRYYPAADYLPGGLLGNDSYRKTSLAMRKIMAKDVVWTCGSTAAEVGHNNNEYLRRVTLTNNYYIGVFEVTKTQWSAIRGGTVAGEWESMRPKTASYSNIRYSQYDNAESSSGIAGARWPKAPGSGSFLATLNARTGMSFDLPSEREWEFACRAGHGDGCWGDGTAVTNATADASLDRIGRYAANTAARADLPNTGTAPAGSYGPNSWGLYDMHGNIAEWVLDFYCATTPHDNLVYGYTSGAWGHMIRGGASGSAASGCRSSARSWGNTESTSTGFRVRCQAGLK